jgi:hypothetical protein
MASATGPFPLHNNGQGCGAPAMAGSTRRSTASHVHMFFCLAAAQAAPAGRRASCESKGPCSFDTCGSPAAHACQVDSGASLQLVCALGQGKRNGYYELPRRPPRAFMCNDRLLTELMCLRDHGLRTSKWGGRHSNWTARATTRRSACCCFARLRGARRGPFVIKDCDMRMPIRRGHKLRPLASPVALLYAPWPRCCCGRRRPATALKGPQRGVFITKSQFKCKYEPFCIRSCGTGDLPVRCCAPEVRGLLQPLLEGGRASNAKISPRLPYCNAASARLSAQFWQPGGRRL